MINMKTKQRVVWVLLCVLVLLCVITAALACLPAWDGAEEDSALWALVELIRSWFA